MFKKLWRCNSLIILFMLLFVTGCEMDITVKPPGEQENEEETNSSSSNEEATGSETDEAGNTNTENQESENNQEANVNGSQSNNSDNSTSENDRDNSTSDDNNESTEDADASNSEEEEATDEVEETDDVSVLNYFPMEVGYTHHVGGNVPDGFGEYVEVMAAQDDYFLAIGASTAVGFYRLYQVNDQEAILLLEVTEEQNEFYDIDSFVSAGEMDEAISYALDHSNMNFRLLKTPLEENASWDDAVVVNTNVNALQTDDTTVPAMLVDYVGKEELRYYAEGEGLVGIVHYSETVKEMFGQEVYSKKIVE